jgi:hypothetical protein
MIPPCGFDGEEDGVDLGKRLGIVNLEDPTLVRGVVEVQDSKWIFLTRS